MQAGEGDEYCINRYRSQDMNLRTELLQIVRRAGVKPWPRPWQNLRASCETELARVFPLHYVTRWIGNTPKVAEKHYLPLTAEDFTAAAKWEA